MEPINVGLLSILPPIIAIALALITRQVVFSLILGIFSGTIIYVFNMPAVEENAVYSFLHKLILSFEYIFLIMKEHFDVMMIIFMSVLGALVAVITIAGGARAYGEWAAKKVKSPIGAKLATSVLGAVIFIDDYFNCLTVGTVMRPITDKFKISREKLAYLIDAMAAPVCIIAPVSSWAASILTYFPEDIDRMGLFIDTIPFNFYAILTIIMVLMLSIWNLDFGPMARFERKAKHNQLTTDAVIDNSHTEDFSNKPVSEKGKVYDLLIPIIALIIFSVLAMLYTGGYFEGSNTAAQTSSYSGIIQKVLLSIIIVISIIFFIIPSRIISKKIYIALIILSVLAIIYTGNFFQSSKSLFQAFGDTEATKSLVLGGFGAILVAFFLFIPRGVLSLKTFMDGTVLGVKAMALACIILTFAWTIKGVCEVLSTGQYVSSLVKDSNMPVMLIPAIVFIIAALLSFSIGTSWGTFGILIPIMIEVSNHAAPELLVINIAATLAGSVFGDHCSPISDTTILSSTGAGCIHIDHVSTQIPYAVLVAVTSFIGFIVAGLTESWTLSFGISIVLLVVFLVILHKRNTMLYGDD